MLKSFNMGEDCPVFDGIWDYCQLYTGGSLGGAGGCRVQVCRASGGLEDDGVLPAVTGAGWEAWAGRGTAHTLVPSCLPALPGCPPGAARLQ